MGINSLHALIFGNFEVTKVSLLSGGKTGNAQSQGETIPVDCIVIQ